jgi:hypothetical protein
MLHSRIALHHKHRLAQPLHRREKGVVFAENHLVVEFAIDPSLDNPLDVGKVADHVAVVERSAADLDFGNGVVPVRVLTDAIVIEQTMAVAELNFFRY